MTKVYMFDYTLDVAIATDTHNLTLSIEGYQGYLLIMYYCCMLLYTVVDCGSPPSITNGSPGTPTSTMFGGTVTYSCSDGLSISGSAMISCLATGSWTTLPSCIGKVQSTTIYTVYIGRCVTTSLLS